MGLHFRAYYHYFPRVRAALRTRSIFAVLGNRVYPPTFLEEINEQCRIFFPLYAAPFFVAWLPYLSIDPLLYPNEPIFPLLRVGLSVVGVLAVIARKVWKHPAKHRFIGVGMLYYLIIATGILTGLSGAHPSYIGGYCFLITVVGAMPVQLFHLYSSLAASLLVFTGLCFVQNVHFDTPALQYSLQDLISTVGVTILLSYGWSVLRRNTYEKGRGLQESNQRIQEQHHELEAKNQELFALNTEKDELLEIVAHDLKNPLAGMKGIVEILQKDSEILSRSFQQTLLVQIDTSLERMFGIVNNVLDIHRLEGDSFGYAITHQDVMLLLKRSVQFHAAAAQAKHLTVRHNFSNETVLVYADGQALTQVLDNILSNAIKYSPLGKTITVRLEDTPETVRIVVQDEGAGIPKEEQVRLFTKFARLSTQPTGGEHSTGLGLSIVKKLVHGMNGRVWCESARGAGAAFFVELPKII
ncbi:MAG: sensor histidine kinase [Candidatus Kapaibacterium sp.]|nr:MAG: sensor histidine kinase [Candidatus Kapabacteria bacterium]